MPAETGAKRRTYYGVEIERDRPNSMGLRWIARNPGTSPMYLRSDTLQGMRELIRYHLGIEPCGCNCR